MEIFILLWVVCGIGAAVVASNRGASGCLWFGLGVLLHPPRPPSFPATINPDMALR